MQGRAHHSTMGGLQSAAACSVSVAVLVGDDDLLLEQSGPNHSGSCTWPAPSPTSHDESHRQPKIMSSSHVVVSCAAHDAPRPAQASACVVCGVACRAGGHVSSDGEGEVLSLLGLTEYPVYVVTLDSGSALGMRASCFMLRHWPWPEQSFRQSMRWHASPLKPFMHSHSPVSRSHVPRFEHSARACALFVPVGTSPQARPAGHTPAQSHTPYHALCQHAGLHSDPSSTGGRIHLRCEQSGAL